MKAEMLSAFKINFHFSMNTFRKIRKVIDVEKVFEIYY